MVTFKLLILEEDKEALDHYQNDIGYERKLLNNKKTKTTKG